MSPNHEISDGEYQALAEFRYQIRKFLRFSEQAARAAGVEPQQHQVMLAIKGLPDDSRATISEVAERLQIQHHSTVELVDRLARRGILQRKKAGEDRRQVLLQLTPRGEKLLRELSVHHAEELRDTGPALVASLKKMMSAVGRKSAARAPKKAANAARSRA